MPSRYLEDDSVPKALEKLREELGEFDYVIASRTSDGLSTQGLPPYELARFDLDYVDEALAERGITLSGHFKTDIRSLLARPFFLQLVTRGEIRVPEGASPKDVFAAFLRNIEQGFAARFPVSRPLVSILSRVAYRALSSEREAFPLSWLTDELVMNGGRSVASTKEMVNWLIARGVLIPYSGGRVSLVHQSITEYCAALELVRLSEVGAFSLRETFALKKWDQCLFLALSMMAKHEADEILDFLVRNDLELALRAVRYAEENQSEAISKMLAIVVERRGNDAEPLQEFFHLGLSWLPLGTEHARYLEELLKFRGSLGAEAAEALAKIRGPTFKPMLLDLLDRERDDFNFSVNGVARALAPMLERADLPRLLEIAVVCSADNSSAVSDLLAQFDSDELLSAARSHAGSPLPLNLTNVLCNALQDRRDKRSFEILSDFVLDSNDEAVDAIYFHLSFIGDDVKEWVRSLRNEHFDAIWRRRSSAHFAVESLHALCRLRPDFAEKAASIAESCEGIERLALLYCLDSKLAILYEELRRLASLSDEELSRQPSNILYLAELDWVGTDLLYPRLLVRDGKQLKCSLLGARCPCTIKGLGSLGIEVIIPIVQMAAALPNEEKTWWQKHQLGSIVAGYGNQDVQAYLLDQLAHGEAKIRRWIKIHVLPFTRDVSTDQMSEDAISYLLADLSRTNVAQSPFRNPLGHVASERFVMERLIPLAGGASHIVLRNLKSVLRVAGDRHGRRYLLTN